MHFIVKVFSEIIIKSPPVRKRFIKQLRDNLRKLLADKGVQVDVQRDWEKIEIVAEGADESVIAQVSEVLAHTPGIANYPDTCFDWKRCRSLKIYLYRCRYFKGEYQS